MDPRAGLRQAPADLPAEKLADGRLSRRLTPLVLATPDPIPGPIFAPALSRATHIVPMTTFAMTLDSLHRAVTGVVVAMLIGAAALVSFSPAPAKGAVLVILVCVTVLSFAFAPCGLEVAETEIRVLRRLAPPVQLPLSTISGVVPAAGRGMRVFGSGGFFGSYGLYWQKGLGVYQRYSTRLEPAMMLTRTAGRPIVVTPDEAAAFRNAVLARLPKA
jgi:Bacterial PH domain